MYVQCLCVRAWRDASPPGLEELLRLANQEVKGRAQPREDSVNALPTFASTRAWTSAKSAVLSLPFKVRTNDMQRSATRRRFRRLQVRAEGEESSALAWGMPWAT